MMSKTPKPQYLPRTLDRPPAEPPTTQMAIGCFVIPLIVAVIGFGLYSFVRANAADTLTVPDTQVALVKAAPDESAPLLARFGQGTALRITGRSKDWRWLQVAIWDNQPGWTLRPLDILPAQLDAPVTSPAAPDNNLSPPVTPAPEEMISIPATTFTMGSPPGLGEADERPAHPVSLSAFEIDRTEVTLGQYWQCVIAGACGPPAADASQPQNRPYFDPAFDNYPAAFVSWTDANNHCLWRGKRLPTEAQWEMAAGWSNELGAKLIWPWGNDPGQGTGNVGDASQGEVTLGGTFPTDRSPSGVMDMAGNLSEWVFDWYKSDYYAVADDSDPVGPSNRRGEGSGRVLRGGSYSDRLDQARTTNRRHQNPAYGSPTIGFRCVQASK